MTAQCNSDGCPRDSEFVVSTATKVEPDAHWHVCRWHIANALVSAFEADPERAALVVDQTQFETGVPTDPRRN